MNNWFGATGGETTIPYPYGDSVYFKISEEDSTKSAENDGQWAVVRLDSGHRVGVIKITGDPHKTYQKRKSQASLLYSIGSHST